MEKNLYEIMQEILEAKKTEFTQDVEFLGTISSNEVTPNGEVEISRDVFRMIDKMPDRNCCSKIL